MRRRTNYAQIDQVDGHLQFASTYNPGLVAALKATVPGAERTWNAQDKVWNVTPTYGQTLQDLAYQYLGIRPDLPVQPTTTPQQTETTILDIRYLGRVKSRPDGTESAYGWYAGGWNVIFPGTVLREWFGADPARPDAASTLYAVLGVDKTASGSAIKKAYRRAARMWHPDVSGEPDTEEQFLAIQNAYEVLGDPVKRAKYEAGLMLEASLGAEVVHRRAEEWRSPLRCGYVMAEGIDKLGRFVVERILAWEDIQDANGRVLVTSWPMGQEHFVERWV